MGLSGRRLTLVLATLLAVIVVVGAAAAFAVGRSQRLAGHATGEPPASPPGVASTVPSTTSRSSQGTAVHSSATTARSPVAEPSPPTTRTERQTSKPAGRPSPSGAPDVEPSTEPVSVRMSARAQASPHAQEISALLMRYFTAINQHDYDAWLTTVSTAQAKRDRDNWEVDYSTTYDSEVYISDIFSKRDVLLVRMQFVSHQAVEFAPSALPESCVRWDVTYQILDEGPGLRVGNSAAAPSMASCT